MIDTSVNIEALNESSKGTLSEVLGIEFTEIHKKFLKSRMPVNQNTIQPLGLLNGGASAALAETTGSMAAFLSLDRIKYYCLGLDLKINHIKSVSEGYVYATATPVHIGNTTHIWQISGSNESGDLVFHSILTMVILPMDEKSTKLFSRKLSHLL